ncbi:MAG: hypothetical protein AUG48_00725 [Actinobacteria bacterium 13_1_20CM_3_68_9]|nr:MAG: hypothetical protein AUG48_00725 [Actinobacteria bacterium 13_1_20CM_3_68_9]
MVRPDPAHVSHGLSITWPRPPQRGHGWLIEKKPWLSVSIPRPPQRGQTVGEVPGFAPLPPQVAQVDCFGTVTATSAPSIACSNDRRTSVSRSCPRIGGSRAPPRRPKKVEKMSPRSEVNPPPLKPRGPNPENMPPASYCLRFSGSESVS